jgi:hypothetical protein
VMSDESLNESSEGDLERDYRCYSQRDILASQSLEDRLTLTPPLQVQSTLNAQTLYVIVSLFVALYST